MFQMARSTRIQLKTKRVEVIWIDVAVREEKKRAAKVSKLSVLIESFMKHNAWLQHQECMAMGDCNKENKSDCWQILFAMITCFFDTFDEWMSKDYSGKQAQLKTNAWTNRIK